MRLWLARHAAVQNAAGVCYGRFDLMADTVLTVSIAQALHQDVPLGASVRCSPARRCRQLADALSTLRPGLPVELDPDLRELDFGAWEGRTWNEIGEAALSAWTGDFARHRPGGGESVQMLLERVRRALGRERTSEGDALWITHAGVIRAVRLVLRGVPDLIDASAWPREDVPFGALESHDLPR
jgi:alpha-ribazole phosphatase